MNTKCLFISTLIAAAAGLTAYANEAARTTPALSETVISEDVENLLACADQKAAESESDAENDVSSADAAALELLFSAKTDSRVAKKTADEFSTEAMMRAWIARYVVSARFAGIRSAKGTGGGLSSGGGVAVAPENSDVPAVSETTASASVSSAGTDAEIDELAHGSVVIAPLGSAGAADAETSSDAATSSASGAGRLLPASVFSVRGAFSAVPAATAFYSLASGSGVSAYTAEGDATTDDSGSRNLTWNGGASGKWDTTTTNWANAGIVDVFRDCDDVAFSGAANVTVADGGVIAGTVTVASGANVSLSGGRLTVVDGIALESGAKLSLGSNSANGAKASLADGSVYEITASSGGEISLAGVSGTGTLRINAVGDLSDTGGGDPSLSRMPIGSRFTGTVEVVKGLLNMQQGGEASAVESGLLGGAQKVVLNGGGLLFRNADNTDSTAKPYVSRTFATKIEVGDRGGVLRVYKYGNVTLASDISGEGTLRRTDGGALTLTGTVNLGGFTNAAGTTNFNGRTTLGALMLSSGTLNIGNTATIGTLDLSRDGVVNVNRGGALIAASINSDGIGGSSLNLNGGTLGTSSNSLTISGGSLPIVLGENTTNFVNTNKYDTETKTFTNSGAEIVISDAISGSGALKVAGAGELTLCGNNTFSGGVTIESGRLVVGSSTALGTGTVTVGANGELAVTAGVTITDVSGGIVLAPGAKIVVDFSNLQNATETFEVTLAEGTAVSLEPVFALAAGTTFSFREIEALDLTDYLELKGWDKSGWTSSLAYEGNKLKLTMSIPEPSQFGLLAGLAALALVGARRRRRK